MEVQVLGPVEVRDDEKPVALGPPKQRAILAALALSPRTVVPIDRLVDLVWGDAMPAAVVPSVQSYVSRLRQALDPLRPDRVSRPVLVTRTGGYLLDLADDELDARRFEAEVTALHDVVRSLPESGPPPLTAEELAAAEARLVGALGRWRGMPYADLGDSTTASAERGRLADLRDLALEDQVALWLALGDHRRAALQLSSLTTTHPLRERLWGLRAIALTRDGRQADALDVLAVLRRTLREELGIEPSPELQRLQAAVLRQEELLKWTPPRQSVAAVATGTPAPTTAVPGLWPAFERERHAADLDAAVALAATGQTTFAAVTGEAGIGRTRVLTELAVRAEAAGFRVGWGRCSQDEDAPPLHPWQRLLADLGLPDVPEPTKADPFDRWRHLVDVVLDAAAEQPLLLVLDDLHWADGPTLRVLRLLAEAPDPRPLLVVTSWRSPHARPTNALGDLAANLGRRHALRIELEGLSADGTRALCAAVAGRPVTSAEGRAVHARTHGVPYLVVAYAREAARTGASFTDVVASVPTPVAELVRRRLALLPPETWDVLAVAAALGEADLARVADVVGSGPDVVLDRLEPARAAGIVQEMEFDRVTFTSAIVRDMLRQQVPASRAAWRHGRPRLAVAHA